LSQQGLNWRTLAIAAFMGVFLAWQLAVPAVALLADRPARFGWQMYSARPELPKAWTVDESGVETPIEMDRVFAQLRAEIDFGESLRAALCQSSGAVEVRVEDPRTAKSEVIGCP
jgi:hypothetical protein